MSNDGYFSAAERAQLREQAAVCRERSAEAIKRVMLAKRMRKQIRLVRTEA